MKKEILIFLLITLLIKEIHSFNNRIKGFISSTVLISGLTLNNPIISNAVTIPTNTYINERYHTSFNYPKDWIFSEGKLSGDRKIEAYTDPNDADTSISIVITAIPADFTKLGSFGTGKDTIRDYLVPKNVPDGVCTSNVLNENVKGETYVVEYTVECQTYDKKHITSIFALRPAESVIGLTLQTKEITYDNKKDSLSVVLPSLNVNRD